MGRGDSDQILYGARQDAPKAPGLPPRLARALANVTERQRARDEERRAEHERKERAYKQKAKGFSTSPECHRHIDAIELDLEEALDGGCNAFLHEIIGPWDEQWKARALREAAVEEGFEGLGTEVKEWRSDKPFEKQYRALISLGVRAGLVSEG